MPKKLSALVISICLLLIVAPHHLNSMPLEEAMMRLRIEALKSEMDEVLARNDLDKARFILEEMTKLDAKIRSVSQAKPVLFREVEEKPPKERVQKYEKANQSFIAESANDVFSKYEKVIIDVCRRMDMDPAVIWTLLEIESNVSEDPVVVQKRTKCLGPWQHQPEHYKHYRKKDGEPYNPFDIYDACEVTVKILKDNLAVTGNLEKSIRMYASGSRYLNTPYGKLPKALRDYLSKFKRRYPKAKAKFEKYGIY